MTADGLRLRLRVARAIGVALTVAGVAVAGAHAAAAFTAVSETGVPGRLQLAWGETPQVVHDLVAGETYHWQIRARLEGADATDFSLALRADGGLAEHPLGLRIEISRCDAPFTDLGGAPACAAQVETLLPTTRVVDVASPAAGDSWQLPPLHVDHDQYFLVGVSTPGGAAADPTWHGLAGEVGFGFAVSGDGPLGTLPPTGADPLGPVILGLGLLVLGAAQVAAARAHAPRRERASDA